MTDLSLLDDCCSRPRISIDNRKVMSQTPQLTRASNSCDWQDSVVLIYLQNFEGLMKACMIGTMALWRVKSRIGIRYADQPCGLEGGGLAFYCVKA